MTPQIRVVFSYMSIWILACALVRPLAYPILARACALVRLRRSYPPIVAPPSALLAGSQLPDRRMILVFVDGPVKDRTPLEALAYKEVIEHPA
jgi:hypothetical protein